MASNDEIAKLIAALHDPQLEPVMRRRIGKRLAELGDPRPGVGLREDGLPEIEWLPVAGYVHEHLRQIVPLGGPQQAPQPFMQTITVRSFYVARYEVTNIQFDAFVHALDGLPNQDWLRHLPAPFGELEMPSSRLANAARDDLSWVQAVAFTRWLHAVMPPDGWPPGADEDWQIRLPTFLEWERAFKPQTGALPLPVGGNTLETQIHRSIPVGMYPHLAASSGALDMLGNAAEWTLTRAADAEGHYLLCGGSFLDPLEHAQALWRAIPADQPMPGAGLRLVCAPPLRRADEGVDPPRGYRWLD